MHWVGDDIDGIIQFGANLPGAKVAAEAERWRYALRQNVIQNKVYGFGTLLTDQ
jgi:hypothetical protein